jgi:ubiquinone/menaquinone biosynthesis C-methylase UbiE
MLPLSNNLAESADDPIHDEKYPLQVMLCEDCGLSQLSIVIKPEIMFSHYVYRSSISQSYVDHCRKMGIELQKKYNLTDKSFVIDIAGNDGALLMEFKSQIGCMVLNVDPAENLYQLCEESGIRMYNVFWGVEAAVHIQRNWHQQADIITATNVFAHVNNVREFIEAAQMVLKPEGKLILEFPYLIDFIDNREFDTIYFEHLSYFSIGPLRMLCNEFGLEIESVSPQNIHGGSVRVTIGNGISDNSVPEYLDREAKYQNIEVYNEFAKEVKLTIAEFQYKISLLEWSRVAGFAASAKGNTLLNCAGVHLKYIIDQTPEKIGKFAPGVRTQIVSTDIIPYDEPDYLVILSWNFADEIISKCRALGFTGKFIIPIPQFKIIE